MNLTNYMQIEQAREDVKALLADSLARDVKLGTGRIWHKPAGNASIKVQGFDVDTILTLNKRDAWNQVRLSQRDDEMSGAMTPRVSAYYRPDGDRYVVTDLGEGVRALRLRTGESAYGPATGVAMLEKLNLYDAENPRNALGGMAHELELVGVWQADLPDAICRVMLASLRVAQS
jgi:hypothetical protein